MNTPAPGRLRLRVWSPLPPSPSGIADYTLEQIQALRRHAEITAVVENPMAVEPAIRDVFPVVEPSRLPAADLDLYHLGNSPSHAYVYRAAIASPGVAVLHEWNLHHLVLFETVEQGNRTRYLREMRRAYGETGTFVGRQMARALGGDVLASRFPLNERILERSLAVVGLTRHITAKAAAAMPGRPVLHVPHHLSLPLEPSRADARRALGIAADELVVTAPGPRHAREMPGAGARRRCRNWPPSSRGCVSSRPARSTATFRLRTSWPARRSPSAAGSRDASASPTSCATWPPPT